MRRSRRAHRRSCRRSRIRRRRLATPAARRRSRALEEFDHEIANIYCEEATELIEASETSLSAWNRDRKDKQRVAELQRTLHTLKGGARMAGILAMGDLSHELETLVILIDGGTVAADDHAFVVMQASLDELARMRDLVSTGVLPAAAQALLGQIRELSGGVSPAPSAAAARATAAAEPAVRAAAPSEKLVAARRAGFTGGAGPSGRFTRTRCSRCRCPRMPCRSSRPPAGPFCRDARVSRRSASRWRAWTRTCSM